MVKGKDLGFWITVYTQYANMAKLKELGFEVILEKRNTDNRFTYKTDIHIIAQKRYFWAEDGEADDRILGIQNILGL